MQPISKVAFPDYIKYCLKSEVYIHQRCSTCTYTTGRIKTRTSVIKAATVKNMNNFFYAEEATMYHQIDTICCYRRGIEHKRGHW